MREPELSMISGAEQRRGTMDQPTMEMDYGDMSFEPQFGTLEG